MEKKLQIGDADFGLNEIRIPKSPIRNSPCTLCLCGESVLARTELMHHIDQCASAIDGRLLQHAVAQVEDVAGAAGGLV